MINNMKTFLLLAALTALIMFAGRSIGAMVGFGQGTGLLFGVGLSGIMVIVSYWFSDKIALASSGAREVTYAEAPDLHRAVDFLCQRAGLPKPRVYIIPSGTPNAFATGRNPHHAAVAVTSGILELLSQDELEGVLAHELAHVKNRDILISSVAAVLAGFISNLSQMAQWALIFGRGNDDDDGGGIAGLLMMLLAPLIAMLLQLAVSRSREYQADATGARICGRPHSLANALEKLQRGNEWRPMQSANPATAHMYIVNPLSGGGVMRLLSTHPPIEERIARLRKLPG